MEDMRKKEIRKLVVTALFTLTLAFSCMGPGDEVDCPVCDNKTELLAGAKCVPVDQVEECGPDGHSHGTECHCFSEQEPNTIGGKEYCLQQGCPGAGGDTDAHTGDGDAYTAEDLDVHACEHLGDTPEEVDAVATFEDFGDAHVDLEHLADITLPENAEGFVHFPGKETGEVAVYVSETGVIDAFLDGQGNAIGAHNQGENGDCPDDFREVWLVEVVNDTGSVKPQIIRFRDGSLNGVRVLILDAGHAHEE